MTTTSPASFYTKKLLENKFASVEIVPEHKALIVTTHTEFIPERDFKALFLDTEKLIAELSPAKLVFDKRSLKVFHQPSMEWYHFDWKLKVKDKYGLTVYRKILPQDSLFRNSVKIGREKIFKNEPKLQQLDITYCESIEEALNS